jgi:ankyrin repeat protein
LTDRTPLLHALFGENVVTFKYLLDHGANQDKANTDGFAPLSGGPTISKLGMPKQPLN